MGRATTRRRAHFGEPSASHALRRGARLVGRHRTNRDAACTIPDGVVAEVMPPLHPDQLVETVGAGERRWEYPAEIGQRVT